MLYDFRTIKIIITITVKLFNIIIIAIQYCVFRRLVCVLIYNIINCFIINTTGVVFPGGMTMRRHTTVYYLLKTMTLNRIPSTLTDL